MAHICAQRVDRVGVLAESWADVVRRRGRWRGDGEELVSAPSNLRPAKVLGFTITGCSGGRQIGRLSPLDGSLPRELLNRVSNRGLEGLTITPDGRTLVATMQSPLQQTDLNGAHAKLEPATSAAQTSTATVTIDVNAR